MNLTTLHEVLRHDGPFATVHLDASHDTEDAANQDDLRWRAVREELGGLDVPARTIAAFGDAAGWPADRGGERPAGRVGRLLVAAGDDLLVDEYLTEPPPRPGVRLSTLPYLLPLAAWHERGIPYVAVAVDQVGADILAVDARGAALTEEIGGRDHPVHKVRGGGWAHHSLQRHAEETVRRNITDVAAETADLARRTCARLVVVAGDARTRAQLRAALPEPIQRIAAEVDHGRGEDPSHHTVDRAIAELLTERHRAEWDVLLERFRGGKAHGLAVAGLRDTTAALRTSNVKVLLVDTREVGDRTVLVGADPAMVALDRADLHALGVSERAEARADEALPTAAIATGADIVAATGDDPPLGLPSGVGAMLRHD